MQINSQLCIDCGDCLVYCPVDAIIEKEKTFINSKECVECGVCHRADICPTDAFVLEVHSWPRSLRAIFSDPGVEHSETGIAGRGTEEIKTNDVTHRYKKGQVNLSLELGRPGVGVFFTDVEKVTRAMAKFGAHFEPCNPVFSLLIDSGSGSLNKEILHEKVMSVVIEVNIGIDELSDLLKYIYTIEQSFASPCSLNICSLLNEDGSIPYENIIKKMGLTLSENGKLNIGIGHTMP